MSMGPCTVVEKVVPYVSIMLAYGQDLKVLNRLPRPVLSFSKLKTVKPGGGEAKRRRIDRCVIQAEQCVSEGRWPLGAQGFSPSDIISHVVHVHVHAENKRRSFRSISSACIVEM